MRLKQVTLSGFRAFATTTTVDLDADCIVISGANGQGKTKEECLGNLKEAIQLLLDTGREEAFRLDPQAETAELLLA